jgi:hypothetical protein
VVEGYRQGKLTIGPPEISGKPTSSDLVANQVKLGEGNDKIWRSKYLSHIAKRSLTCRKVLRHRANDFTSTSKEVVLRTYRHLKSIDSAEFKPAVLESNAKHANYYTTEATKSHVAL